MIEHKTNKDIYDEYKKDADKLLDRISAVRNAMKLPMSNSDRMDLAERLHYLEVSYDTVVYAMKMMRSGKL